jgi:hypothetical protein
MLIHRLERLASARWSVPQAIAVTLACALLLVGLVFATTPLTTRNHGFDSDGTAYAAMAGDPTFPEARARIAPFCFRVLTPFLVSTLPFDSLTSFTIVAFVSNVLSLALMLLILGVFQFSFASRVIGTLLYAGSFWVLKFSFYSPAYIDYQTNLLLLVIVYATLKRWHVLLPVVFAVAALQRESLAVFSAFSVIHILRYSRLTSPGPWIISLLTILSPLVAIFIVRMSVQPDNAYTPLVLLDHIKRTRELGYWLILCQALFSGLGVIPLLLVINYEAWPGFLRDRWEWLVYGCISLFLLFGGVDKARLFLYFLPLGVILVACNLDVLRRQTAPVRFAVWMAIVLVAHLWMGHYLTPMGTFEQYLARMVPEHAKGRYIYYLAANLGVSLALLVFTIPTIFGALHFRPASGLTRPPGVRP